MCKSSMIIVCLQIDPTYNPPVTETRTLFGIHMEQRRNDAVIDKNLFSNIVTKRGEVNIISTSSNNIILEVKPHSRTCMAVKRNLLKFVRISRKQTFDVSLYVMSSGVEGGLFSFLFFTVGSDRRMTTRR